MVKNSGPVFPGSEEEEEEEELDEEDEEEQDQVQRRIKKKLRITRPGKSDDSLGWKPIQISKEGEEKEERIERMKE